MPQLALCTPQGIAVTAFLSIEPWRFPLESLAAPVFTCIGRQALTHWGFQTSQLPSHGLVSQSKLLPGLWPLLHANSYEEPHVRLGARWGPKMDEPPQGCNMSPARGATPLWHPRHPKIFSLLTFRHLGVFMPCGIVKSSLKIPPRHNGVVPIKITGQTIKDHRAYFITDETSTKGRDPNINIISAIHCIKGKTSVNILVSNYTNKHIKFNKGEYIGCLEPTITDSIPSGQSETHPTNSVTLQKMMAEQVQQETFNPPCHKLKSSIEFELNASSKGICLAIHQGWNDYRHNSTHRNDHWYGQLQPCIPETLPNCNEELPMGKGKDWEIAHNKGHLQ